jgi:hypothetical protein
LADAKTAIELLIDGSEHIYFDNVTFNARKELLKSPNKINIEDLKPISPPEYADFTPLKLAELTKNFNEIATNFKYFPEADTNLPLYDFKYRRPEFGFVEASLLKWLIKKLLVSYGHFQNGEMQATQKEFEKFIYDIKSILEELKLWSPNPDSFISNIVLLADLFQHQSNGDLMLNEKEITEYLQMVLAATTLSGKMLESLQDECKVVPNSFSFDFLDTTAKKDLYPLDTKCLNEHFYETFLNKLNFKQYFPRLNDYYINSTTEEAISYLAGVEGFARDDNSPGIPIGRRDLTLVIGAMLNIESTFIRFDSNKDNELDYDELTKSLEVYRYSIITLAKLGKGDEDYAPSVFMYMVSRMKPPKKDSLRDKVTFYLYYQCLKNDWCRENKLDPILAKRLNIGSLLSYLVYTNKLALKEKRAQALKLNK